MSRGYRGVRTPDGALERRRARGELLDLALGGVTALLLVALAVALAFGVIATIAVLTVVL